MADAASASLVKAREFLDQAGLPAETAQEYYIPPGDLDSLKTRLLEATRGNYHVMTREENGQLHVIAFVNIRGIGELFKDFADEALAHRPDDHSISMPPAGSADSEVEF